MSVIIERTAIFDGEKIPYILERKQVKNINLRICKNGEVYVSANDSVSVAAVDEFVANKGEYILKALNEFRELEDYRPKPKKFISGETFYIQGRGLRLKVSQSRNESISTDGVYIYLNVKDTDDFRKKHRMVTKYMDCQCKIVFGEILAELYPQFRKYGIEMPVLRIRDMETRWGSCLAEKGVITLNKRLLRAPRHCIEYVVMHELCHFVYSNHTKQFYDFLTMFMPDWKERKMLLDKSSSYWF